MIRRFILYSVLSFIASSVSASEVLVITATDEPSGYGVRSMGSEEKQSTHLMEALRSAHDRDEDVTIVFNPTIQVSSLLEVRAYVHKVGFDSARVTYFVSDHAKIGVVEIKLAEETIRYESVTEASGSK